MSRRDRRLAALIGGSSPAPSAPSGPLPATPSALAVAASGARFKVTRLWELFDRIALALLQGKFAGQVVTLSCPPQHGKSSFWSLHFPAWVLAHKPEHRILMSTYSYSFAARLGRKVKDLVERNPKLLGIRVRSDVSSASEWELAGHEGGVFASGIEGGISGRSADLAICDDPIKDAETASSLIEKDRIWEWWQEDLSTRLQKGGTRILIMTRKAIDDPIGRVLDLAEKGIESVVQIKLPALPDEDESWPEWGWTRKAGEALVPELHDEKMLRGYEKLSAHRWASQYQQKPYPKGGNVFKSSWFRIAPDPGSVQRVRVWDLAISEAKGACYTAGALVGVRFEGGDRKFHVENIVYGKWGPGERDQRIIEVAHQDGTHVPILIEKEGGSGGTAQIFHLRRALAGWALREASPKGSKELRADALASAAQCDAVTISAGPWNTEFLQEVESFPHGKIDLVDACAHGVNHLSKVRGPIVIKGPMSAPGAGQSSLHGFGKLLPFDPSRDHFGNNQFGGAAL